MPSQCTRAGLYTRHALEHALRLVSIARRERFSIQFCARSVFARKKLQIEKQKIFTQRQQVTPNENQPLLSTTDLQAQKIS